MTADNSNDNGHQTQGEAGSAGPRGRKPARKRSGGMAKRGRKATASRRSSASSRGSTQAEQAPARSRSTRGRGKSISNSSGGFGARLLARAGRAIPLASRGLGDQRVVQRLADERPYVLGAIGLGIGAVIGLMLPGTLSSMAGRSRRGRTSR
ncbi:hypothetical protein DK847_05875 [Aestuariivirga litoralis]|uniref:Uncharacterized protein n=1 Tax=Aestuariivirga litoralis TaxID=2650924 RepID=A0A2W2BCK8_9HYPH|nr:hypothetical protein [Aestuariivirga litoralis]PZF77954.1 hypothetical protein DK847_05875 [Aestuariivirga litoralis]